MNCQNCGYEIESGAKFCNNCGVPQQVAPVYENTVEPTAPQYNSSVPYNPYGNLQPPVQAKKSNKGCIVAIIIAIALIVIAVIGVVVLGVIGYNVAKDVVSDIDVDSADNEVVASDLEDYVVTGLTYEEIFSSNNIVETPTLFMTEESCSFAYAETDGYVEKSEYGFENDVIMEMVDTYYFPLDGYNDEEKDAYMTLTKADFTVEENLSFCTVTYNTTNSYLIVTVKYTHVDNKDNLKEMQNAGLLEEGDFDYLSMEETEKNYISIGFVKK